MSATRRPLVILFALLVVAASVVAAPSAWAGDPESENKRDSKSEDDAMKADSDSAGETRTYTNADLERMFGPPPDAKAHDADGDKDDGAKPGAKKDDTGLPDALDAIEDAQARERMRKRMIAATETEITKRQAEVKRLERRILQIRNPLLPRPEAGMTPEEVQQWQGLSATERVALAGKELDQARADLAASRAKLDKLKTQK